MQPHPLCLNYRYDLPCRRLLEAIKATAKSSLSMIGTTLEASAAIVTFLADLGQQAKTKYAADYSATYQGVVRLFPLHVTLGKGFKPQSCMSIYMDWDPTTQQLLLARFGRHGRGA